MQYRHSLKLNSLRFFNKGLVHYLLHDLLTLNAIVVCSRLIEDKSACNRSPCDMKLGSIQQVQLLQK